MKKIASLVFLVLLMPLVSAKDIKLNSSDTIRDFFPQIEALVVEAYERAGHTVELVNIPGERSVIMLQSGELDADVMRLANFRDTVPEAIPVQVVLTNLDMLAVVKADSTFASKADLVGKKMASVRGIKVHPVIAQQLQAVVSEQSSIEASAKMIAAGRADYLPVTQDIANTLIATGLPLKVVSDPLIQIPFFTWVTPANADIVPGLEAALKELKAEGRF